MLHSRTTSDNTYFLEQLGISWYLDLESDMSQVPAGASKVGYVRVPSGASAWVTGAFDSVNEMSNDDLAALGMPTETELEQIVKGGEISYHVGGAKLYHSSRLDPRCCS